MADIRHNRIWRDFLDWCTARRLRAMPAHPWTLAAYLRWCDAHRRIPDISRRLETIAWAHFIKCAPSPHRHPIVARTLRRIEAHRRARESSAALFPAGDIHAGDRRDVGASSAADDRRTARRPLRSRPPLVERRPSSS